VDIRRDPRLRPCAAQAPLSSPTAGRTAPQKLRRRTLWCEAGATGIEYALIASFIAIAITMGATMAGNGLNAVLFAIGNKVNDAADISMQTAN